MTMKLLLALALLATPATAKTWFNDDCSLNVTSGPGGFAYEQTDAFAEAGGLATVCHVESWPVSSAVATMKCDNGSTPKMEIISDEAISFDGQTFSTKPEHCVDE
jgi:hypothetical protein